LLIVNDTDVIVSECKSSLRMDDVNGRDDGNEAAGFHCMLFQPLLEIAAKADSA